MLEDIILPKWRDKYIRTNKFTPIINDLEAYKGFFVGQNVAMNYGYAYRLASFSLINQAFQSMFGNDKNCEVLIDKGHNFTLQESINDHKYLLYRHNAERLLPNDYAILSGYYTHPSYIVSGGNNLTTSLNTIDHGLGSLIEADKNKDFKKVNVKLHRFRKGIKFLGKPQTNDFELTESYFVKQYFKLMSEKNYYTQL